jgi:hypothetical protein
MRDEVSSVNKGKTESQTRNHDIKCFHCLGVGHIASQCLNKRTMIAHVDGEVETEIEGDDDQMQPPEDACDDNVAYLVEGESLVARHAFSAQVKEDDVEQQIENIFHTRCDANQGAGHVDHTHGNGAEVAQDPLSLPSGPITRLRAKRFKEALYGLI